MAELAERVEAAEQVRDRLAREHVALALAVHDQLQAIEAGAVQARMRTAAAERDRERMAREHTGFARLVLEELRTVGAGIPHLRERADAADRRLDELAETVAQVATAGAIVAAQVPGNGQVRQLRPPTPRRGR